MDSLLFIGIVTAVLVGAWVFLHFISRRHARLNQDFLQKKWQKIERLLNEEQYALAVIEADKLLDRALKESGVRGDSMGGRLKNADGYIRDIDRAWSAHKLRNKVVHESSFTLKKSRAQQAVSDFKRSLKSLGAKL